MDHASLWKSPLTNRAFPNYRSWFPLPYLEVVQSVAGLVAWELLVHSKLLHVGGVALYPTDAFESHWWASQHLIWHSLVSLPCILWHSKRLGFPMQCVHPMIVIGIPYITEMSSTPQPLHFHWKISESQVRPKNYVFRWIPGSPTGDMGPYGTKGYRIIDFFLRICVISVFSMEIAFWGMFRDRWRSV